MRVAIIGAGLAGTACAYYLKHYVSDIKIYDAESQMASGASGNDIGLINPRFSAFQTPESDYFASAFSQAISLFETLEGIDWHRCGALHLMADEKKKKRFPQTIENWGWPGSCMRLVDTSEASEIAGLPIRDECLYLPDSGFVSPKKLCATYAQGVDIAYNTAIENLTDLDADVVILACGIGVQGFEETAFLPVQPVRGQVTQLRDPVLSALKVNLCYGGYCSPALDGVHTVGATFQRWLDHADILPEDDVQNLENLGAVVEGFAPARAEICGNRASVRTATKDHFPIVGALPDHPHIYLSCGHGSHGVLSSLAGAQLLADMILGRPKSQSIPTMYSLSPQRFLSIE